jgi:hypothetical protein
MLGNCLCSGNQLGTGSKYMANLKPFLLKFVQNFPERILWVFSHALFFSRQVAKFRHKKAQ